MHVLIYMHQTYMKAFLEARILSSEHVKVVFGNIGSFRQIHEQIVGSATQVKDGQNDFSGLGGLMVRVLVFVRRQKLICVFKSFNADAFLQFISSQKESNVLVKAAKTKKRFQTFLVCCFSSRSLFHNDNTSHRRNTKLMLKG